VGEDCRVVRDYRRGGAGVANASQDAGISVKNGTPSPIIKPREYKPVANKPTGILEQ